MRPGAGALDFVLLCTTLLLAFAGSRELLRGLWQERAGRRGLESLRPAEVEPEEERYEPPGRIERRLRAAGLPIGPVTFFSATAVLTLLVAVGLRALFPAVPLAALGGGLVAARLPWTLAGTWGRFRSARFEAGLAEALGFMVGSLEAGENPLQAFATAADASRGAVRRELADVARRLRFGMSIRRSLRAILEGYDSEGVRLFVQTLVAKWQAGGDLVPILQSVARIVRERLAVRLHLRSHLAGARVVAVMIAFLPYAVIPVYLWRVPSMVELLLRHPLGPTLITGAVLFQIVGWMWLGRILRIELLMGSGFGLDLLMAAAFLAAVAWLYRQMPAEGPPVPPPAPRAPGVQVWQELRSYYPRVARQAGFDPGALLPFYWLAKALLGLALPLALSELASRLGFNPSPLLFLLPLLLGFLLPDLWLLGRRRRRQRQIARSLGYFVDLLVAFLYSGLSLERAFVRAGREGFEPGHPLGWELALVGRELEAGQDPSLVFQALAERTGVGDLRGIAAALRIGLRVGAPVRTTLQAQAEMLWTKRREMALRQINAAAAKVMLPVMLCGFPIFLLLTFFPAVLAILDLLRRLREG